MKIAVLGLSGARLVTAGLVCASPATGASATKPAASTNVIPRNTFDISSPPCCFDIFAKSSTASRPCGANCAAGRGFAAEKQRAIYYRAYGRLTNRSNRHVDAERGADAAEAQGVTTYSGRRRLAVHRPHAEHPCRSQGRGRTDVREIRAGLSQPRARRN